MPGRRTGPPEPAPDPIRLVVVEPRPMLSVGVREILERETGIEVVAQVASPDEALQVVDQTSPNVVLLGSAPAESSESEATMRLRRETPDAAFVVLGGADNDASIVGAVEMGAMAHVPEVAEPAELVATIRRVANGEDPLQDELEARPDIVERILGGIRDTAVVDSALPNPLSPREIEILGYVAEGLGNRDVAAALDLSEQTVKNTLSIAMHKLGAPNRTRAVMSAIRNEWIPAPAGSVPPAELRDSS
jgi:DNA-binding NarL/FixJ family response regulator